jgi:hypothetical protein
VLTVSQYDAMLEAATPRKRSELLGHSPGKAAHLLGVSRQAVHQAIDRGTLDAFYVHDDNGGRLAWIVIPDYSLRDYLHRSRARSLQTTV